VRVTNTRHVDGIGGVVRTATRLCVPPHDESSAPVFPSREGGDSLTSRLFTEPSVQGTLEFARIAWLALGRVRAGAHRAVYDPRRWSHGSQTHMVLQVSGSSVLEHSGHSLALESGHFALVEADCTYAIMSRMVTERVVIVIGRERLALEGQQPLPAARAYSTNSGLKRLLYSTVTGVVDELYDIRATHAPLIAGQLTCLLHATLHDELALGLRDDNDVRRQHVRQYVAHHLRDPKLSLDQIAAALHWSRRTLTRIFAGRGETLMQYVYRQRLEGVRRDLLNLARREDSLTEIALGWGFSNYSHFCERFHRHFGSSPASVRRALSAQRNPRGSASSQNVLE
jgi:AraC family transcriptional regulator, positive regulator of tynA and feaB